MVHKFYHLITKIACLDEVGSGLPPAKLLFYQLWDANMCFIKH